MCYRLTTTELELATVGFHPHVIDERHPYSYSLMPPDVRPMLHAVLTHAARAGLQPIPESYCAVIGIFVGAGDMDTGKAVFNSMQRAGHDARPGWLAFVKACFHWG